MRQQLPKSRLFNIITNYDWPEVPNQQFIRHLLFCMRPAESPFVNHYPLAIGLVVLLLPYFYNLLFLPFTALNYFTSHQTLSRGVGSNRVSTRVTGKVDKTSLKSLSSSISTTTTSAATSGRFNFWRGVQQIVGPKWEESSPNSAKTTSSKSTKSTSTSQSTFTSTSISVQITTVKDVKTVTESVTQTVQVTVEKPVEEPKTEGSVIIEEIDSMGWHQVFRHLEID